jgi:hypothetical protein
LATKLQPLGSLGVSNVLTGRLLVDWTPTDRLSVSVNLNATQEKSHAQAAQEYGIFPSTLANAFTPEHRGLFGRPAKRPGCGLGSRRQPARRQRHLPGFRAPRLCDCARSEVHLDLGLHALQERPAGRYRWDALRLFSGVFTGNAGAYYQELRLSGDVQGRLNWIVGANYQSDKTYDQIRSIVFATSTGARCIARHRRHRR